MALKDVRLGRYTDDNVAEKGQIGLLVVQLCSVCCGSPLLSTLANCACTRICFHAFQDYVLVFPLTSSKNVRTHLGVGRDS